MKKFLKVMEIICWLIAFGFVGFILFIPFGADLDLKLGVVRESGYYATRLCLGLVGMIVFALIKQILTLTLNGKMFYIILSVTVSFTQFFMRALFKRVSTTKRESVMISILGDLAAEFESKKTVIEKRRAKIYE